MKPSPIINVANGAPASTPKPAGSSSSDQSFGQVLAQQVNAPSSPSSAAANGSAQNAAPSNAAGNAPSSSSSSASGSAGNSASGANGSTVTSGKNVKTKHGQDDSDSSNAATQGTTDPNAANGSAQLLALVSNVQQAVTSNATTVAADASSAIGSIAANTASTAQAALANFQAAVIGGADSAKTAVQDAASGFAQDIKAALPQDAGQDTQDVAADGSAQDPSSTIVGNAKTATTLATDTQNTAAPQTVADLAAGAQKDVQADIASLAQAAAKSADAIRDTAASAAAAAPAIVNTVQLSNVASQVTGADDNKLTPQVGSTDWNQALGQKVVWMVAGGQQSASLTLNPPDLGPMQVVLNVTNSHATATFTAAQPEVRQALENAMPKLREMLGDAGIQLGQASVNAGQQQQNFANQTSSRSGNGGSDRGGDTIDAAVSAVSQAASTVVSGIGLVDTFA